LQRTASGTFVGAAVSLSGALALDDAGASRALRLRESFGYQGTKGRVQSKKCENRWFKSDTKRTKKEPNSSFYHGQAANRKQ
jgi:hypothetical protein